MMQRNLSRWADKYVIELKEVFYISARSPWGLTNSPFLFSCPSRYIFWLNLPSSNPNYKSFAVCGPPGSGKTAFISGLCTLVRDNIDLRPNAWHFATQADCNR